jgi:Pvc16 N-terminal domain
MIDKLLGILKQKTDERLRMGASPDDPLQDRVVFPSDGRGDYAEFEQNVVTILLVNLEQERTFRPDDPYLRTLPDGAKLPGKLPIALNAYVLFVARFAKGTYAESLQRISQIAQLFQERPVLDHENTPDLDGRIEKLVVELVTLTFSEQNHLWGVLRTTYLPSLLYRVRMLVFQDAAPAGAPPVDDTTTTVRGLAP